MKYSLISRGIRDLPEPQFPNLQNGDNTAVIALYYYQDYVS